MGPDSIGMADGGVRRTAGAVRGGRSGPQSRAPFRGMVLGRTKSRDPPPPDWRQPVGPVSGRMPNHRVRWRLTDNRLSAIQSRQRPPIRLSLTTGRWFTSPWSYHQPPHSVPGGGTAEARHRCRRPGSQGRRRVAVPGGRRRTSRLAAHSPSPRSGRQYPAGTPVPGDRQPRNRTSWSARRRLDLVRLLAVPMRLSLRPVLWPLAKHLGRSRMAAQRGPRHPVETVSPRAISRAIIKVLRPTVRLLVEASTRSHRPPVRPHPVRPRPVRGQDTPRH